MVNQRDWDPEIDGAAAREGRYMRRAFRRCRSNRPRGVRANDVKRDFRVKPKTNILVDLNVINGKATR
jgi:hypothetical protein